MVFSGIFAISVLHLMLRIKTNYFSVSIILYMYDCICTDGLGHNFNRNRLADGQYVYCYLVPAFFAIYRYISSCTIEEFISNLLICLDLI